MKHVFEGLTAVGIQRMIKGVEDSVLALWPVAGSDFRRFNLCNGSTVLVGLRLQGSSEVISVHIDHPDHPNVGEYKEQVSFVSTMIGRRNMFREFAEDIALELSLAVKELNLNKEV